MVEGICASTRLCLSISLSRSLRCNAPRLCLVPPLSLQVHVNHILLACTRQRMRWSCTRTHVRPCSLQNIPFPPPLHLISCLALPPPQSLHSLPLPLPPLLHRQFLRPSLPHPSASFTLHVAKIFIAAPCQSLVLPLFCSVQRDTCRCALLSVTRGAQGRGGTGAERSDGNQFERAITFADAHPRSARHKCQHTCTGSRCMHVPAPSARPREVSLVERLGSPPPLPPSSHKVERGIEQIWREQGLCRIEYQLALLSSAHSDERCVQSQRHPRPAPGDR